MSYKEMKRTYGYPKIGGKPWFSPKIFVFFHRPSVPTAVHLRQGKGGKIPLKEMSFFGSAFSKSGDGLHHFYTPELGGGFKYFLFSPPMWGRFPIWLIFFRWVETTNQPFLYPWRLTAGFHKFPGGLVQIHFPFQNGWWFVGSSR